MSINPRKYRHPVTVEYVNPDATGDANGVIDENDDDNWIEYTTGFAEIHTTGGREVWRAQQINPSATHLLRLPYSEKLSKSTTAMRFDYRGTKLNIAHGPADVDTTRRELEFVCEQSK